MPPDPLLQTFPDGFYDPVAEGREFDGMQSWTAPDPGGIAPSIPAPVQLHYLISKATERETLAKLEYVWEIGYRQFNADTCHNILTLKTDWHMMFDDSKWILVPESNILEDLVKIYLIDNLPTSNLAERYTNQVFNYYILPVFSLHEVILRFILQRHEGHPPPPYSLLRVLTSRVQPHYVVFDACQKILTGKISMRDATGMRSYLRDNVGIPLSNMSPLDYMQLLYEKWTGTNIPNEWRAHDTLSNLPPEEVEDDFSQARPPAKRQRLEAVMPSQESRGQTLPDQHDGGQQQADFTSQPPEDEGKPIPNGPVVNLFIEYIHKWRDQVEIALKTLQSGGPNDLNDAQLAAYDNEHARTPPPPDAWDKWKPAWKLKSPGELHGSMFSSNDWAVFRNDVYLTRPERS